MKRITAAALLLLVLVPAPAGARPVWLPATGAPALAPPLPRYASRNGIKEGAAALQQRWRATSARLQLHTPPMVRFCAGGVVSVLRGIARVGGELGRFAASVSGVGSIALAAHAGYSAVTSHTTDQRLEALGDFGEGMCGFARAGYLARPAVRCLGTLGAALQCTAGVCEIVSGIRNHNRDRIVLGTCDVGAGLLFGAAALALANPYTLVAAVAVTAVRFLYAKRHGIASAWKRLGERIEQRRAARAARRAAETAALAGPPDTAAAPLALPAKRGALR